MPTQGRGPEERSHHHEMPPDFEKHHEGMKRFPSLDELREIDARWGIDRSLDPTESVLRFDRHIARLAASMAGPWQRPIEPVSILSISTIFSKVLYALSHRRVNHKTLTSAEQNTFNQALQAAHADNSYQAISVIHSQNHMMHSMMGVLGTQRFLPWHRLYLSKLEAALRKKQPSVMVPYWDYANDPNRPDWVWQPPGVVRNTPGGATLPTQSTINSIMMNSSYTQFTSALEFQAHNSVHNWCHGTVSVPMTAAQDPIFWLLHANVDRIWDKWQLSNSGVPALIGPAAEMDPWTPTTASDVNDITDIGYSYS